MSELNQSNTEQLAKINSLAFVFPGQGSQAVGMLSDLGDESIVIKTFEEASSVLGYDLWQLVQQGPAESLNETHRTQPALLTASIALWRLWNDRAQLPGVVAGHSLGEYSALVAADSIDLASAVKLVEQRGLFMQQAVPAGTGKMAAIIGLDDELIVAACNEAAEQQVVSPVNFNSPGQVVIAGNAEAVERAMVLCKDKGAKRALPLAVSVPSHCALMKPAAESLAEVLETIEVRSPKLTLINNVDVATERDPQLIRDALVRQLYCPVRWTESVVKMEILGINRLIECGPGSVLTGLTKRISKQLTAQALNNKDSLIQLVTELS